MPKFSFEFQKANSSETVTDVELPDLEAVRQEAIRSAREAMTDGIFEGFDRTRWITRVTDENGNVVLTLSFSELLERE